jgi:uncharacterized membrane protein
MPKNRLEAFADGIFAIAATLLILNVTVTSVDARSLGPELVHIWPSYVAYAITFVTIGIIWINHHTVLHQIAHVDRTFLTLNVVFLMLIAFIPFPTRLLAQYIQTDGAQAAALAYGITLTMTALFFNVIWRYAAWGGRLLRQDADPTVVEGISRSYLPGPAIYLAATLVALVNPLVSAGLYGAFAVFYALESGLFGRRR